MIFVRNLFILIFLIGCASPSCIKPEDVKRLIEALSSDEMMGRRTFTDGTEKAASFIAKEFENIGLQPVGIAASYFQPFEVLSVNVENPKVVVNKVLMDSKSYFMRLSEDSLNWNNETKPAVKFIKENDDFRREAESVFSTSEDILVIVSPAHKDIFERYRSYLMRPQVQLPGESKNKANVVFILLETDMVNQVSIEAALKKEKKKLKNVVGVIEGKRKEEIVLFSAHYDHLGIGKSVDGDSIYNGANDDASGVTAVIELAQYFKQAPEPERTLMFVAFTAEEIGGFGSRYFSSQVKHDEVVAMLNIEMIGKPSKEGKSSSFVTGWNKSDLGEILQGSAKGSGYSFFPDPYPKQNLFYRSDNATLAHLGVPAHSISTTQIDVDKDYHQVTDEVETLDIDNIASTINAITIGVQGIVDGTQTPRRIKKEDVE